MPGSKKLLVVANPEATRARPEGLSSLSAQLRKGFDVETCSPESPEQARRESERAVEEGFDIVAALGGDGTFRVVAEGIAGSRAALLCLPAGSRNVFARITTGEAEPEAIVSRMLEGTLTATDADIGYAGEHAFLFAASVGLSARASDAVNRKPGLKARFGAPYGIAIGIFTAASYLIRPPRIKLTIDSDSSEAVSLICQNARPLTYLGDSKPVELCEHVSLTSGTISIGALRELALRDLLLIPSALVRRGTILAGHPRIEEMSGLKSATIEALGKESFPVDIDGDGIGRHRKLEITVRPGALRVMMGSSGAGPKA